MNTQNSYSHSHIDPVVLHIGQRLRMARCANGANLTRLGGQLGIAYQQIQKYEKGLSRIPASHLWYCSQALQTPISFFFDGLEGRYIAAKPLLAPQTFSFDIGAYRLDIIAHYKG